MIRNRIDDFDIFDGGIISWEVKLIKPEPRIYELLLPIGTDLRSAFEGFTVTSH